MTKIKVEHERFLVDFKLAELNLAEANRHAKGFQS